MKLKISIMTEKSYPQWLCVNKIINILHPENDDYYWQYQEIKKLFDDGTLPVTMEIEKID